MSRSRSRPTMAFVSDGRMLTCVFVAMVWVMTSLVAGREGFKDYTVYSLGERETLWCNASFEYLAVANDSVPVAWMLPDLTVLYDTKDRFYVGPDKYSLEVVNITKSDLGLYHCMLKIGPNLTDWYLARLGLNSEGPYFLDMWKEYEMNTIIGISAGLGFLAIAVASILIYHFRWQPDEESVSSGSTPVPAYSSAQDESSKENITKDDVPEGEEGDVPLENLPSKVDQEGGHENQAYLKESIEGTSAVPVTSAVPGPTADGMPMVA